MENHSAGRVRGAAGSLPGQAGCMTDSMANPAAQRSWRSVRSSELSPTFRRGGSWRIAGSPQPVRDPARTRPAAAGSPRQLGTERAAQPDVEVRCGATRCARGGCHVAAGGDWRSVSRRLALALRLAAHDREIPLSGAALGLASRGGGRNGFLVGQLCGRPCRSRRSAGPPSSRPGTARSARPGRRRSGRRARRRHVGSSDATDWGRRTAAIHGKGHSSTARWRSWPRPGPL